MKTSASEKSYRILSVILFILILLTSSGINKYVQFPGLSLIVLIIHITVLHGYYRLSLSLESTSLKRAAQALIITSFAVFTANFIITLNHSASELFKNPLLYSPNFITGLALLYFAVVLFKMKELNSKSTRLFALVTLINAVIYLSFYLAPLIIIARWFYFGFLSYQLFPGGENSSIIREKSEIMKPESAGLNYNTSSAKYMAGTLGLTLVTSLRDWSTYVIILTPFALSYFMKDRNLQSEESMTTFVLIALVTLVFLCALYFRLIVFVLKRTIYSGLDFKIRDAAGAVIIHSLKLFLLYLVINLFILAPVIMLHQKAGDSLKGLLSLFPVITIIIIYLWGLMGYSSGLIYLTSMNSFKNSLILLRSRYTFYNIAFMAIIVIILQFYVNSEVLSCPPLIINSMISSVIFILLPVYLICLTRFVHDYNLLREKE